MSFSQSDMPVNYVFRVGCFDGGGVAYVFRVGCFDGGGVTYEKGCGQRKSGRV